MKVFAISRDGQWFKIGESNEQSKWYGIGEPVRNFISSIKKGDAVNIKYTTGADNKRYLSYIQKTGSAGPSGPEKPTSGPNPGVGGSGSQKYAYPKSPEERADIKRQAIGHMTSRTMIGLQAHINTENVTAIMESIYKKYQELVG